MVDLSKRSEKAELMDDPLAREDQLLRNLRELDLLNRYGGGHRISIKGMGKLDLSVNEKYHLVDMGCGSGDAMKYMAAWARRNNLNIKFTGVDVSSVAVGYLNEHCREFPEIKGREADWITFLEETEPVDILHCSLFCHHLPDKELIRFLNLAQSKTTRGILINDLRRSRTAYLSAWLFPRLLNGSSLAKHDGPLSVRKAFTQPEMEKLLRRSGIKNYEIESGWPFRYLITINSKN